MAQAVVDGLEVVEIEEQYRELVGSTDPAVKRVRQSVRELRPIGKLRQRVVERLEPELLLERLPLAHVADVEDESADRGIVSVVGAGDLDVDPGSIQSRADARLPSSSHRALSSCR